MAAQRSIKVQNIRCVQVRAGNNDRKVFDPVKLQELATSIHESGLAQPITLRPVEKVDGVQMYEVVAGERRFRSISEILGWETVPALVRDLSDEEAAAIMLVENTGRVDLDPIAEAHAYQTRMDKFGWEAKKIAETAGVSVERVKQRVQLLSLAEDVQHFVRTAAFPIGHALIITDLDVNRQRIALRVFNASKSMPLTRFQELVAELRQQQIEESQMDMFAAMLIQQVQNEVIIRRGKKARTGAPISDKLPAVQVTGKDSAGDILDRYITVLMQQGHSDAAAAIGTVYNALVAGNWLSVPASSVLAKTAEDTQTAGDAPVEQL